MEIVVEPSEGQHAASWEAMIALAIDSSATSPRNIPFRFRRDPLLARPPERPELTDVAGISTSGIGEELARRTWKKPFQLRIVRAPELNSAVPQLGVQVLHTIASVEEGYAGIRLRLGENNRTGKRLKRTINSQTWIRQHCISQRYQIGVPKSSALRAAGTREPAPK